MTVKELITELEKCKPDAEIYTENSGFKPASNIEDYTGDGEIYVIS